MVHYQRPKSQIEVIFNSHTQGILSVSKKIIHKTFRIHHTLNIKCKDLLRDDDKKKETQCERNKWTWK